MLINYNKIYFSLQRNIHTSYYALFHPEINICMTLNLFCFRAKINKMNIIVIFFYKSYVQHFTNEFDITKSSPNSLKMALKCIRNFDLHFTQYMRICRTSSLGHRTGLIHNYRDSNPWPHPSCALSPCHPLRER